MSSVFICQVVDLLSKKITHTFMASSHEHAVRQFQSFLKSLEGHIHNDDFVLQVCDHVELPETFVEAEQFCIDFPENVYNGCKVMEDEA